MPTALKRIDYANRESKPLHDRIVQAVKDRVRLSEEKMKEKRKYFDKLDDDFLGMGLPEMELDAKLRVQRDQSGKPNYTTIQVPYTYAETMTMHTYFTSVMLARSPVMQYMGRHGETQMQKMAVEALMNYQIQVGRNVVPLYIWLLDAVKYGVGFLGTFWDEDYAYFTDIVDRPLNVGPLAVSGIRSRQEEVEVRMLKYSGNRFFNVRPQNAYPDPRVPVAKLNDGEFFGRKLRISWNDLVRGEREGRYMNVKHVKRFMKSGSGSSITDDTSSNLVNVADESDALLTPSMTKVGMLDGVEMKIELIPNDWGLGASKYPRKWVFTVINDVVIEAREQGAFHDTFGYFAMEPEADGHSFINRAPGEVIKPLENVLTWMFNSHFYNVRRALVDQYVINPMLVEMDDIEDPLPGGYIRLKPAAYDRNPKDVVHQLGIHDVTQQHVQGVGSVIELIQRIDGINDSILGQISTGGRKTATEVRSGTSFGVSRLKSKSEYCSAQGMLPLAQVALQLTQQYYEEEMEFRIIGDLANVTGGKSTVNVSGDSIAGFYDFVPIDGSAPIDRFALASLWRQIFVDAARVPQLQQTLDFAQIFSYTARLAGAVEVDQFRLQAVPDQQFADGVQAGNIVPMGGATANARNVADGTQGGLPGLGQVSGVGPSG